jgi:hypothetical protein
MRRRIVGLVVVCVVVRLRVERVVAVVANSAWSWVVIVVIIACGVGNVFYRVLCIVVSPCASLVRVSHEGPLRSSLRA